MSLCTKHYPLFPYSCSCLSLHMFLTTDSNKLISLVLDYLLNSSLIEDITQINNIFLFTASVKFPIFLLNGELLSSVLFLFPIANCSYLFLQSVHTSMEVLEHDISQAQTSLKAHSSLPSSAVTESLDRLDEAWNQLNNTYRALQRYIF